MQFESQDTKPSNNNNSQFFEGVMNVTISSSTLLDANNNQVNDISPYEDGAKWDIEVLVGEGKFPNKVRLFGGKPLGNSKHKWVKLLEACGIDPTSNCNHQMVVGKKIKALFYAKKPNVNGKVFSEVWSTFLPVKGNTKDLEDWFQFAIEKSKRIRNNIHPQSKWMFNNLEGVLEESSTSQETDDLPF